MIPEPNEPTRTVAPAQWNRLSAPTESLAQMTTFATGGKVAQYVEAYSEAELIDAIESADRDGIPLLVLGGGSNILASSTDFPGRVVRDARQEISTVFEEGCPGARMHVSAGTPWDAVVVYAIEHGWMGMEALSGIPGTAGAAIVQNIGAYGQEVAGTVVVARTYDRLTRSIRTLFLSDMALGYRASLLKDSMRAGERLKGASQSHVAARLDPHEGGHIWSYSPRWIVLDVDFQLRLASMSEPVRYGQLADLLGVEVGTRVPSTDLRAAVLELRRGKGMVLDDADRDTYSAGSFFTNPILSEVEAAALPQDAPRYSVTDATAVNQIGAAAPNVPGLVKTSAAWLISRAGFTPGFNMPGPAAISRKHSLALTNRGGARGEDIAQLARTIRDSVREQFGVTLEPEPVLVGLSID